MKQSLSLVTLGVADHARAKAFYEALGFTIIGRSPVDDAGRPFPVLHMQQHPAQEPRRD